MERTSSLQPLVTPIAPCPNSRPWSTCLRVHKCDRGTVTYTDGRGAIPRRLVSGRNAVPVGTVKRWPTKSVCAQDFHLVTLLSLGWEITPLQPPATRTNVPGAGWVSAAPGNVAIRAKRTSQKKANVANDP